MESNPHTIKEAVAAFGKLLDAVPRGKKMGVFNDAAYLEITLHKCAVMLKVLRQHFLDTTGEESPFVKKIDELLPRT